MQAYAAPASAKLVEQLPTVIAAPVYMTPASTYAAPEGVAPGPGMQYITEPVAITEPAVGAVMQQMVAAAMPASAQERVVEAPIAFAEPHMGAVMQPMVEAAMPASAKEERAIDRPATGSLEGEGTSNATAKDAVETQVGTDAAVHDAHDKPLEKPAKKKSVASVVGTKKKACCCC